MWLIQLPGSLLPDIPDATGSRKSSSHVFPYRRLRAHFGAHVSCMDGIIVSALLLAVIRLAFTLLS